MEMGLVFVVAMGFPLVVQARVNACDYLLMRSFAIKQIADAFEQDLLADLERGLPGWKDVRNSRSIKGCLVFVQQYFDLIRHLWQAPIHC